MFSVSIVDSDFVCCHSFYANYYDNPFYILKYMVYLTIYLLHILMFCLLFKQKIKADETFF